MRTFAQKPKTTQETTATKSTTPDRAHFGQSPELSSILHLRRTIGNQAVQRMLQTDAEEPEAELTGTSSSCFGHDFSRIPAHPPMAEAMQTKLAVNQPGDIYEQEADRVAEQVLALPTHHAVSGAPPHIQRFSGHSNGQIYAAPASVDQALGSPGRPLESALRQDMEQRFGHDFSQVRVHTDAAAEQSTRDVRANAYTMGNHIVFGAGRFAPSTKEGGQLIAHELTHVVQQSGSERIRAGRGNKEKGLLPVSSSRQAMIQRDGPATGRGEEGRVLTVVIRAPDDQYTQNVTDYVRNTLNDQNIIEVDNLQEVFPYLDKIKQSKGPKLKKIRLIAHGSTIGGIKMKMPGKKNREFVNPAELEKIAQDKNLQQIAVGAMEGDATVEFYGCYVGGQATTNAAISTMFQSEFRAPDEALHTEDSLYIMNGKTVVTSSHTVDEVAKNNKKAKDQFDNWLLYKHKQLVEAGDIPDAESREDKIAAMRNLFDRSKGRIKQLIIEKRNGDRVHAYQKAAFDSEIRRWTVN